MPAQPPVSLGLDSFYTKYVDAGGIPIVGSSKVRDSAFGVAYEIVVNMLSGRPDIRAAMISNGARVGIMARTEVTLDIPEHSDLDESFNTRARGLGGTLALPITTVGEENLLCDPGDSYRGESILVHEFSHGIYNLGVLFVKDRVQISIDLGVAYFMATIQGLWANTYAAENPEEYQAEGVQSWFNANLQAIPADGIHNNVNTRDELKNYDPSLAAVLEKIYPDDEWEVPCS